MVLPEKTLYFFHGFWGQASDFEFLEQKLLPFSIQSVEYTRENLLGPQIFLSDWGDSFLQWLKESEIHSPIVAVGYSQGGRLLLHAFERAPEMFKRLILISVNPGLLNFEDKEKRLQRDRQWACDFRKLDWDDLEKKWNSQEVFKGGRKHPRFESEFDREALAMCFENWSLAHQADFRNLIKQHSDKVEVIVGEHDTKYMKLYDRLNFPRLWKAKGAAHRVPSDQPDILVEILNSILKSA